MNTDKLDEIRSAMSDYKVAVLRGLKQDQCDPCWRKAVLALPFLFDDRTVEAAKRHLRKPEHQ